MIKSSKMYSKKSNNKIKNKNNNLTIMEKPLLKKPTNHEKAKFSKDIQSNLEKEGKFNSKTEIKMQKVKSANKIKFNGLEKLSKTKKQPLILITLITFLYLELFYKISIFGLKNIFQPNTLILLLLLLPISSIIATLGNITKSSKKNKVIYLSLISVITVFFNVALIFKKVFNTYFCLSLFGLSDQAIAFTGTAILEIFKNIFSIIGLFVPFILTLIFQKHINFHYLTKKEGALNLLCLFLSIPLFEIITYSTKEKENSIYHLFNTTYNNALNIEKVGVLPALYLDFKELIFKYDAKITEELPSIPDIIDTNTNDSSKENQESSLKYDYNNLSIDFENLIANEKNKTLLSMHKYFQNDEGTLKNAYTGLFKDKNLIVIMAESLNTIGIREDVTPTLYKLVTEGFNFTNFYTPVNLSTIGGEFQNLTGLFANLNDLNKYFRKGTNYFPFGLGTTFNREGYDVKAYHANDAAFQNRNTYLKNMGFDYFKAKGTGLEKLMDCNKWPASDDEMVKVTTNEWIDSEKFLTYYVSVSSHMPYNRSGNAMVTKNWSLVKDLNYSDEAKGYLASVIELDKAVASLIKALEEAGKLEDTVIAIIPDHYPYSMNLNSINELSTFKRDDTVEVNHSSLIIWNASTPSVTINKTASQLDFLPTIYNLFGIDYDSRLFMGKDILSTESGLAYFQNKSWVSDYGTYFASSGKFVPKDDKEVDNNYIANINKIVANRINMSKLIIENDYYRKVYPDK